MAIMIISGKVSDMFGLVLIDDDGNELIDYDGYVPYDIGVGGGDYIELRVDIESGQILGWTGETVDSIREAVENA